MQLKEQFDQRYPNLIENSKKLYTAELDELINTTPAEAKKIEYVSHSAELLSYPQNAYETLNTFATATGYEKFDLKTSLKDDKHSKLLEHFNYTFKVNNFSLIVLKHYTRHRMQSLATAPLVKMTNSNKFIMPETISAVPELKADFEKCIKENRKIYNKLLSENINPYLLVYVAPHATAIDFVTTVNARELLHLSNLRTCTRAQWQIRYLVTDMLKLVKKTDPKMFECFGPSCYTYGVCPEGRMCCGKQLEMKQIFDNME
jgi:thymidylate synthase (FAD)